MLNPIFGPDGQLAAWNRALKLRVIAYNERLAKEIAADYAARMAAEAEVKSLTLVRSPMGYR